MAFYVFASMFASCFRRLGLYDLGVLALVFGSSLYVSSEKLTLQSHTEAD